MIGPHRLYTTLDIDLIMQADCLEALRESMCNTLLIDNYLEASYLSFPRSCESQAGRFVRSWLKKWKKSGGT